MTPCSSCNKCVLYVCHEPCITLTLSENKTKEFKPDVDPDLAKLSV